MICKRLQRSHLYKKRVATFELSTSEKYSFCSQFFYCNLSYACMDENCFLKNI